MVYECEWFSVSKLHRGRTRAFWSFFSFGVILKKIEFVIFWVIDWYVVVEWFIINYCVVIQKTVFQGVLREWALFDGSLWNRTLQMWVFLYETQLGSLSLSYCMVHAPISVISSFQRLSASFLNFCHLQWLDLPRVSDIIEEKSPDNVAEPPVPVSFSFIKHPTNIIRKNVNWQISFMSFIAFYKHGRYIVLFQSFHDEAPLQKQARRGRPRKYPLEGGVANGNRVSS